MRLRYYTLAFLPLLLTSTAWAQNQQDRNPTTAVIDDLRAQVTAQADNKNDVVLDVPNLKVEQIKLEVEELQAKLNLYAQVANLVQLNAGADVGIKSVKLEISGVEAQLLLLVDLDNVAAIISRTLQTLDNNPELIQMLGQTLQQTVGTVGNVANQALAPGGVVSQTVNTLGNTLSDVTRPGGLLSQTVNTLGQTVYRTVNDAGDIVEHTVDQAGNVVNSRTLGSVGDLTTTVSRTTNQAGQTVRRVMDDLGNVIEYTADQAGHITGAHVVQRGNNPQR